MAGDSYDYDVIIVGCGVGGHGAALHARAEGTYPDISIFSCAFHE